MSRARVLDFLGASLRLWVALVIAVTLVPWLLVADQGWGGRLLDPKILGGTLAMAGLIGAVACVAALPLVLLRDRILSPRPPFVRLGYGMVLLFGPLLLLAWGIMRDGALVGREFLQLSALYEVTSMSATVVYVGLEAAQRAMTRAGLRRRPDVAD